MSHEMNELTVLPQFCCALNIECPRKASFTLNSADGYWKQQEVCNAHLTRKEVNYSNLKIIFLTTDINRCMTDHKILVIFIPESVVICKHSPQYQEWCLKPLCFSLHGVISHQPFSSFIQVIQFKAT